VSDNDSLEHTGGQSAGEFKLVTLRIHSFRARDCALAFGFLAVFSLFVATVFAALGAWLILPFAGLEAFALYLAFAWVRRHAQDMESLSICGDAVALAVRDGGEMHEFSFHRSWARLVVDGAVRGGRLALRSHGREVEVGRFLNAGGREALARELRLRLRQAG
jgi:uncharacterized membrane protein